jgi:hypothetical protein
MIYRHPHSWSAWVSLSNAEVPRQPGVYLARQGAAGPVVYVGMAGERSGQGLRGRLRRYTSGKALASGLGEAVFDRALADANWLRERLAEVETSRPTGARPPWLGRTFMSVGPSPRAARRPRNWRRKCWRWRSRIGGTATADPRRPPPPRGSVGPSGGHSCVPLPRLAKHTTGRHVRGALIKRRGLYEGTMEPVTRPGRCPSGRPSRARDRSRSTR